MTDMDRTQYVLEHYRKQAHEHGLEPSSTMLDLTTRELEIQAILRCVEHALEGSKGHTSLLEVGCGNGFLLEMMRKRFPRVDMTGVDYSPEMVALASQRHIPDCTVLQGDVRSLDAPSGTFNVAVAERCIINLPDAAAQADALRELHRALASGGHLVLIEAFTDGLANLNLARVQLGLAENVVPAFNLWIDKEAFLTAVDGLFEIASDTDPGPLPGRNFLSSHYFISRVLYPSVTKREILHNTEFVKFFRFLPPQGNFSPIQLYFLRKID